MAHADPVGGFLESVQRKFDGGAKMIPRVFLVWGLDKQDTSECSFGDDDCIGKSVFTKTIDFYSLVDGVPVQKQFIVSTPQYSCHETRVA